MISDTIDRRGKQLRKSLEQEYKRLSGTHTLQPGVRGTDVTDIVSQYIPIGTSFIDGEDIERVDRC